MVSEPAIVSSLLRSSVILRSLVVCSCWGILSWAVLSGCAHNVQLHPPYAEPVFTPTYAYQQLSLDIFQVWTPTRAGLADAKAAIGCGICIEEPRGSLYVYRIQRFRQPER